MQLRTALPTQTVSRGGSDRWDGAVEFLQPAIFALNISGIAGSLLAVAGLLAVAATRAIMSALQQSARDVARPYIGRYLPDRSRKPSSIGRSPQEALK